MALLIMNEIALEGERERGGRGREREGSVNVRGIIFGGGGGGLGGGREGRRGEISNIMEVY